jgi:hypothetical protein
MSVDSAKDVDEFMLAAGTRIGNAESNYMKSRDDDVMT